MQEDKVSEFNEIIKDLIEKSLFTERQIQIILNIGTGEISRGAYYRQRAQCRQKMTALFYSMVLAYGLGLMTPQSMETASRLAGQVSIICNSRVADPGQIIEIIDKTVAASLNL